MNIYKKFFEQKNKSAKHWKYSLTKTVTVAGDDIDLRQNKLRSLHISKSIKYKYKYRKSALYLKRVNKKSRIRNICTIFAYRRFRSARSFAMSETVHLGACVVISYIINLFLEAVWPTSESAGLEVTGWKCILAIIVGVGIAFALVKLRGWRKARQLYADKLKSSLSDTVFEASELSDDVYVTVYGEKSECRAD